MLWVAIGVRRMKTVIVYVLAAFAEIAGCFSFWAWLRPDKSIYLADSRHGRPRCVRLFAHADR